MHSISIQPVGLEQLEQLQQIGRQTFFETFAASNSEANMQQYLQESFALEKLRVEVGDPATRFYFAQQGEQVIGYLKLNFGAAQTELQDDKALEIERIYVSKAFHGKNVGQLLYDKAIEVARQADAAYVWLGVWEENQRAIRFYEKNGFVPFDKHIFKLGDEEQTDIMMRLNL
ncbi:MAG: GNAT family N-acetyltransferase [Chitinophagales bacterium]|nr:GNAT family N-acetyltransferase [Chitinophagales bacterium]